MFASIWPYILSACSVVFAIVGVAYAAHTKGKASAQVEAIEQRAKDAEALAVRTIEQSNAAVEKQAAIVRSTSEITEDVNAMSDADAISELHREWSTETPSDSSTASRR